MTNSGFLSSSLLAMLAESSRRSSELHGHFLRTRQNSLQGIQTLFEMQIQGSSLPAQAPAMAASRPALFDSAQLDAFGVGQITRCFGKEFARYESRKIPRIPNGDLKMMSRVVSIEGRRGDFDSPAGITVEYDVPVEAWYFLDSPYPDMPVSLIMETALQPCGFLSAYLDTYALVPYEEYFFRNLDGTLAAAEPMDVRGKTITTQARLLSSVNSGGTVIQRFAFTMTCMGRTIYTGESTFGYFAADTMRSQVGLDGGRQTLPEIKSDPALARDAAWLDLDRLQTGAAGSPYARLSRGRLNFLQQAAASLRGGRYGKGYLYASRPVNPQDWFYPFHFFQDPVMPGSLGVEAVVETMQAAALAWGLGAGLRSPRFTAWQRSAPLNWRYRGQITPQHHLVELEVHLSDLDRGARGAMLRGDASLWVDGLRIYEVKDAAVALVESE